MSEATLPEIKNLYRSGRLDDAEALCRELLRHSPESAEALHLLGVVLIAAERSEEAIDPLRRAAQAAPARADFHSNLAAALNRLGRFEDAVAACDQALAVDAGFAEAHVNRAAALRGLSRHDEALASVERALVLRPAFVEAQFHHAAALIDLGRIEDGIDASRRALAQRPQFPQAQLVLVRGLLAAKRYAEAAHEAQRALDLQPESIEAMDLAALAFAGLGNIDDAYEFLRRLRERKPNRPNIDLNFAISCLTLGHYEEGWRHFECRFLTSRGRADSKRFAYSQPRWDGSAPAGRTLLLQCEQGLGDTLQFARYALVLQARGARIVLRVQPALRDFLSASFPEARVEGLNQSPGPFDFWAPMMSLPYLLGTTLSTVPAPMPYLMADGALRRAWSARLNRSSPAFRVGVAWAGSPNYRNDHYRSMNLEAFAPLAAVPGVSFYSLQHGPRSVQVQGFNGFDIADLGDAIGPFEQMAALMCELDLIISVDTAVSHLAGGMALPCWVLLAANSDWRWLRNRSDSPWYPSIRLFRQEALGDWSAPLAEAAAELRAAVRGSDASR